MCARGCVFNRDHGRGQFQQDKMTASCAIRILLRLTSCIEMVGRNSLPSRAIMHTSLKPLHIQYAESEYGDGMCLLVAGCFGV